MKDQQTTDFANKYRPISFGEVVGQEPAVNALMTALDRKAAKSFLITGPSGTGKTTLARIAASYVGCEKRNLVEIDAATHTGIDAMRSVAEAATVTALGKSGTKVYIIDEAHRLSTQAWDSLLKVVEEPPKHLFWIFCSTDPAKIPATIKTRCAPIQTANVNADDLFELLEFVTEKEELDVHTDTLDLIVEKSNGSPRQALSTLSVVCDCKDTDEAERMIVDEATSEGAYELCRAMIARKPFTYTLSTLRKIEDQDAETVRRIVFAYFSKVAMSGNKSSFALASKALECFAAPYPNNAAMGYVLISLQDFHE